MGEFRALEDRCGGELVLVVVGGLAVLGDGVLGDAVVGDTVLAVVLGELVRGRGWRGRSLVSEGFGTGAAEVGAVDAWGGALLAWVWWGVFGFVVIGVGGVIVVGIVIVVIVVGEDLGG